MDAFLSMDDELIDKSNYCRVVSNKLSDDEQLKNLLVSQFDRMDRDGDGIIDENQVKEALARILRKQVKKMTGDGDGDES